MDNIDKSLKGFARDENGALIPGDLLVGTGVGPTLVGFASDRLAGLAFAGGMAGLLLFQMLVNVGMVLGVMPITGIPLPFISSGGASLVSLALGLGILESIAMRQGRPGG